MDDRDEVQLQELLDKFINEATKTVNLIEALKTRASTLAQKGRHILIPEIKQCVRKQSIAELEELTEKLVSINIDLELDYIDCPNFVIPYFTPAEDTVHKLNFLSGDNPWNFWLVDKNVDTKGILKKLLHKYQNGLLDPVQKPKAAQSVCFIDRNKVVRGVILQIKNENRIKIVDCDSNVTKVVASDKLFKVDEDACCLHASALRCTITEEPDAIELWKNADLRDWFCNTLRDANLGVRVLKRVAGSFPMFVVDVELQNEDEESTASLREWILGRLMPELKKIGDVENEQICDYLSEESLFPYYKAVGEKVINNEVPSPTTENRSPERIEEVPHPINHEENRSPERIEEAVEIQNEELNNLDYPTIKSSEKTVTNANESKEDNNPSQAIINNLESKVSTSSEEVNSSSLGDDLIKSSSKESLLSDCSQKAEPVSHSRINCKSEEFRPKAKKPDIPRFNHKYQNKRSPPQYNQPYPTCPVGFVPRPVQPWPYVGQPLQQVNNSWSYTQQAPQPQLWSHGQDSPFSPVNPDCNVNRSNKVNVMAPEFVPRISNVQQPKNSNKVELHQEPITLRKSATLIKENENLLVLISHVESPSEFYIHFVNQSNKYLGKLYDDMFTYYSTREKIVFESWREARSKLGRFCACKWSKDNHWYRVEVLDWAVGDGQVKVLFVDYGNSESVPLGCLQPLMKTFEKLSICSQACHLAKVHPAIKGQPWSEEAIDFFKSKVEATNSRVYSVTVVQSSTKAAKPNSFSVLLYEGKAEDNAKSINDLLVDHGLAWSRRLLVEPTSSNSSEKYHSLDDLTNSLPKLECDLPIISPGISGSLRRSLLSPNSNLTFQIPSNEVDEAVEQWDPRKEDFESVRNNPALDLDDACVAVSGYSARDEARICEFYARKGFCYKAVCYKEHSMPRLDGTTTDREEVYEFAFSQLVLPKPGEVVRLKITCVHSTNLLYAQIEEKKGIAVDDEFEDEAETLTSLEEYMNKPENVRKMKCLTVSPSPGEMVLAREVDEEKKTEWWYRARVITAADDNPETDDPEIMFVDYGSVCTVSELDLRKMDKQYLHLPFQAIECSIANVVPLEVDEEISKRGTELLQNVLLGQVLTAKVYESINHERFQQMEAVMESNELGDVGEFLIANGYAVENKLNWHAATANDAPLFYPG